jgi:hypothetical protein
VTSPTVRPIFADKMQSDFVNILRKFMKVETIIAAAIGSVAQIA